MSLLLDTLGVYQAGVQQFQWPAFKGGAWLEPWHFFAAGYLALVVTAFVAYHKLAQRKDELAEQLNDKWREERRRFEADYAKWRDEWSLFQMTIKNLLIQSGGRQVVSGWHDYLPDPRLIYADFYEFCFSLWSREGYPFFDDELSFEALKKRFRQVAGFFDRIYDLLQDFPTLAPAYLDDLAIQRQQYDALHVIWYLAHAQGDVTYGDRKQEMYVPPPKWQRVWIKWNEGVAVPTEPCGYDVAESDTEMTTHEEK